MVFVDVVMLVDVFGLSEVYGMGMLFGDLIEVGLFVVVYGVYVCVMLLVVVGVKVNFGYVELVVGMMGLFRFVFGLWVGEVVLNV